MPEYLAPGVYVEEVSFRAKSIEGVSTSVTGFIGPTRYGPVGGEPELLTSFADFERIYGDFQNLEFEDNVVRVNYVAHAVRAFFDNGGRRLYVTRINDTADGPNSADAGRAFFTFFGNDVTIRARFPGRAGEMGVLFAVKTRPLKAVTDEEEQYRIAGLRAYDVVYIARRSSPPASPDVSGFYDVVPDGDGLAFQRDGLTLRLGDLSLPLDVDTSVHRVHLAVSIRKPLREGHLDEEELIGEFAPHPRQTHSLTDYFSPSPNAHRNALTVPFAVESSLNSGADLLAHLLGARAIDALEGSFEEPDSPLRPSDLENRIRLQNGSDGSLPSPPAYRGSATGVTKTGLETFADIEEIAIVAAPGSTAGYDRGRSRQIRQITQHLLTHVERMRYRIAVLDAPAGIQDLTLAAIRDYRGRFDSSRAALYYPWVIITDPLDPDRRREIILPPSGFVAGIYARSDTENGVHKAPANAVVRGAVGLERLISKAEQDVLNPEGINCFRFFEGRGYRLWGARTISADPEWKYISVRRLFAYLEHSISRGTQWAVFESNNEALWNNIRRVISNFLISEWRQGAFAGNTPDEAFFVRCDRSTMTQDDLDSGRLICQVGIAAVKPAEFVIFRIGQWTADRRN